MKRRLTPLFSARRSLLAMIVGGCLVLPRALGALSADGVASPDAPGAAEAEEALPLRPQFLAWVEGSPEENVIWRGWPVLVRVQAVTGTAPADVQLRGPTAIALQTAKGVWFAGPAESEKLSVGNYTLTAGGRESAVTVVDPPRDLNAGQRAARFRLLGWTAILAGDTRGAQETADAWVRADPSSSEAYEAQGDAWRALQNPAAALAAYDEAVRRIPPGIDPPPAGLHAKISALLFAQAALTPTRAAVAPQPDEVKFYHLVDAGDAAFLRDDRTEAARLYAEAEAFRREKGLAITSAELDEKRASLGGVNAGSTPSAAADHQNHPAVESTTPPNITAPVASSLPLPAVPVAPASGVAQLSPGTVVSDREFTDAKIAADPNSQWANAATAGSQYGKTQYSAAKATGAPDVPVVGNSPDAWCPEGQNSGTDWLEVSFARPVHATEVRVRQNDKPGAIAKVEAIESDGTTHVWWKGVDPYVAPATREIAWFVVRVPRTDYLVAKVKLTLNLAAVPGWKEIDAVQLVGTKD